MKRRARERRSIKPGKESKETLPIGKLPQQLLDKCLQGAVLLDPTVLQGPGPGNDAAIIVPPPDEMIVIASDPITFASAQPGAHLLAVNINDVVTTGANPRWLVLDLLLPPSTREEEVEALFESIGAACREQEVTLVGGHTEITDAVTRPVAVGTLVGSMKRDRRVDPARARPGDRILLIGPIALEGTAILARHRRQEVERVFGKEFCDRAEGLLVKPGICIRSAALLAVSRYLVHALHDPTEGGLSSALLELAAYTRCGLDVDAREVEVLPETQALCEHFKLDPFGLLASGSLLAVLSEDEATRLARALEERLGIRAKPIGTLTKPGELTWRDLKGKATAFPRFARDEIVRVLK